MTQFRNLPKDQGLTFVSITFTKGHLTNLLSPHTNVDLIELLPAGSYQYTKLLIKYYTLYVGTMYF